MDSAPAPAVPIAVAEVLGLPLRFLPALPLPSSLLCSFFAHEGGRVILAACAQPEDPPEVPAFVGPELAALALAAEHDRANAAVMRGWCAKKPAWRLTSIEAIGRLGYKAEPLGWNTGQVLRALGLQLDEVRL